MKQRITTSRFIKLKCIKCKNEQIAFGKPSTKGREVILENEEDVLEYVRTGISSVINRCGKVLIEPRGGKGIVKSKILEVLE